MRTTIPKVTATVALFLAGMTGAVAQLEFEPRAGALPPDVALAKLRDLLRKSDIPDAETLVTMNVRIVGGHPTRIEQNPWQVALVMGHVEEPRRSQFCGGSIIADRWVITAAHCVDNRIVSMRPGRVNVVAGTATYKSGGERIKVRKLFVHKDWDSATMNNDIALLQLSKPLTESDSARPIRLVEAGSGIKEGTRLTVTGWGYIEEGGSGSDILLGATVPAVSNSTCNASYDGRVTGNMFCAGQREGGVDSCQGDSGGPIWTNINKKKTLVGLVSWGVGCARKEKYGIYTRLANYHDWVVGTMRTAREVEIEEEPSDERATVAELDVNEKEWSQLSQAEKDAIETVLRESRLIDSNVMIMPRRDSPRMVGEGDERWSLSSLVRPLAHFACRRGCEAIAATAISACGSLAAPAVPVCVGLAGRGQALCKRKCP